MFLIQNIKNDGLLMSWLTRTMTEEVLTLLVGLETTCQIWLALEESFAAANKDGKVKLRQQLQQHRKGNRSVEDYIY